MNLNEIFRSIILSHIIVRDLPSNNSNNTIIKIHLIPHQYNQSNIFIKIKKNKHVSHLPSYKKITNTILSNNLVYNTDTCSICYEHFKLNEYYRILPICKHFFHKKCIDMWFYNDIKNMKCPICRTSHNKEEVNKYNNISSTSF